MLVVTQADPIPLLPLLALLPVRTSPLLLPREEMRGLLDLEAPIVGVPCLWLRLSEEEAKTAGRCCLVLHLWAEGTLLELSSEVQG